MHILKCIYVILIIPIFIISQISLRVSSAHIFEIYNKIEKKI